MAPTKFVVVVVVVVVVFILFNFFVFNFPRGAEGTLR